MPTFTARVELLDAALSDYANLYTELRSRGFSDRIKSVDGRIFMMPPAEYNRVTGSTCVQVRNLAKEALDSIGKEGAILVTMGERCWLGLTSAE